MYDQRVRKQELSPQQKASLLNEDHQIYGTFAEIGGGQEVARHFFQAGHASQTIAKTISAYDMSFSDDIYGKDERYVCIKRLSKMLDHEYELLEKRLKDKKKAFFVFANTVTIAKRGSQRPSHGWMGVRFQKRPGGPVNEITLHIKTKDQFRLQQQEALGILGVNLIYASFYKTEKEEEFVKSLLDHLDLERVEVDFIKIKGEDISPLKNEMLSLHLLKEGVTPAVLFLPEKGPSLASDFLFEKSVLVQRGVFKPVTKTNIEIMERSLKQIQKTFPKTEPLFELSIKDPENSDLEDISERIHMIQSCGFSVLVSRLLPYHELKDFLRSVTAEEIIVVLGASHLESLFDPSYEKDTNESVLQTFGKLFDEKTKMLVFPYKTKKSCQTSSSFFPPSPSNHLFSYLKEAKHIEDVLGCEDVDTSILSKDVREMVKRKDPQWKDLVPSSVRKILEKKNS